MTDVARIAEEPDEMVAAVEQWLKDNPPLMNAALRNRIEALTAAGDALANDAAHQIPCLSRETGSEPDCSCGLSEALAKWADAKGDQPNG
jgi:hypothetical protein